MQTRHRSSGGLTARRLLPSLVVVLVTLAAACSGAGTGPIAAPAQTTTTTTAASSESAAPACDVLLDLLTETYRAAAMPVTAPLGRRSGFRGFEPYSASVPRLVCSVRFDWDGDSARRTVLDVSVVPWSETVESIPNSTILNMCRLDGRLTPTQATALAAAGDDIQTCDRSDSGSLHNDVAVVSADSRWGVYLLVADDSPDASTFRGATTSTVLVDWLVAIGFDGSIPVA